jgi:hypothetical protein
MAFSHDSRGESQKEACSGIEQLTIPGRDRKKILAMARTTERWKITPRTTTQTLDDALLSNEETILFS